ncbi:mitochondrial escape protein 2 [Candidozyma auris]|uniref:Mitochondrial escape protein 2 n=2 Tax=Candidozyma auris TaxID=498019 RepID=A0A2H0ZHV8_CANAR|nr:hypothetical protein QG37_06691 [[Candida] auris]PIS49822.1 hypothetical protein B9J08_004849 [[Candida] auris]QWW25314.1 hypothetical protein CA7LBN_004196 [[Candida] auris]
MSLRNLTTRVGLLRRPVSIGVPIYKKLPLNGKRWASDVESFKSETCENDTDNSYEATGVIDYKKQHEVLIFFDNIYPRWLAKLEYKSFIQPFRWLQKRLGDEALTERLVSMVADGDHPLPKETCVTQVAPLIRDGGVFVKFVVPPNSTPKELTQRLENNIKRNRQKRSNPIKDLYGFWKPPPRAYQVKGTPWIEDLSRFPSPKLKVKFQGDPLTEEELYLLFRRYGQIKDIVPASSSTPYATVVFRYTDSCIRAKNCVTGLTYNNGKSTLHLQYIPVERVNYVANMINNHQRIAIPIILAILATIAVLIFEPIREQFIKFKINHRSWNGHKDHWLVKMFYVPYRTLANWITDTTTFIDDSIGSFTGDRKASSEDMSLVDLQSNMFLQERSDKANDLKMWLYENANTFIIVRGPRGSGKREFVVENALSKQDEIGRRVLELDCATMVKARNDKAFLKSAASQLGYFPIFTWTNSISQFVDLGVQGLTGQKSGLSESKETQFKNMLQLTASAIRKVALADFESYKAEVKKQRKAKSNADSDASFDNESVDLREDDYLQSHPKVKPVIVVENFLRKSESSNDFIYKSIADWAAQLIQSNTAHVIFITSDASSTTHLTAALPNQVFKTVSLADASMQSAKHYVMSQLKDMELRSSIDHCLVPIGGRMLDLQAFVRRVRSGESADDALHQMVSQAAEQITTFFLNVSPNSGEINWSTDQIWALMRHLADRDSVSFAELAKSPLFGDNHDTISTLQVLEKNDLILLQRDKGIVSTITTGRPLYKAAFKTLVEDKAIFKLYESRLIRSLIKLENAKIAQLEDEISKISEAVGSDWFKDRLNYVESKINASTQAIRQYENQIKEVSNIGVETKKGFFGF